MTETERLRELLDERGAEWRRTPHYSSESIDNETVFRGEGIEWIANGHLNGHIGLRALRYEVTPEQAVEATLGRGTCRMVLAELRGPAYTDTYECSECGGEVMVSTVMGESEPPKWCPNCGRKVVK